MYAHHAAPWSGHYPDNVRDNNIYFWYLSILKTKYFYSSSIYWVTFTFTWVIFYQCFFTFTQVWQLSTFSTTSHGSLPLPTRNTALIWSVATNPLWENDYNHFSVWPLGFMGIMTHTVVLYCFNNCWWKYISWPFKIFPDLSYFAVLCS
jgi:hypothetical protein